MLVQLLVAATLFASIALYAPQAFAAFTRRQRLRLPHRHLILVFRLWFGALALATLWILLRHPHAPK